MIQLKPVERLIVRDLYTSEKGLNAYTLYRRYRMPPSLLTPFLLSLKNKKLITIDGSHIKIAPKARRKLEIFRSSLIPSEIKPWREVPRDLIKPKMPINEPYVPNINLLDKDFFKIDIM